MKSLDLTTFDELRHDTWVRFSANVLSSHAVLILLASHHLPVRELQFLTATTSKMALSAAAVWMHDNTISDKDTGGSDSSVKLQPPQAWGSEWQQTKTWQMNEKKHVNSVCCCHIVYAWLRLLAYCSLTVNCISKPWPHYQMWTPQVIVMSLSMTWHCHGDSE